jgi:prophage antirepressor-like protein
MNALNDSTLPAFGERQVQVVNHLGDWWMTAMQIGEALEYSEPRDAVLKIYERNSDELEEFSVTVKLTATDGKAYETRVFNEEGVMLICMFSNQPRAKEFRRWAVMVLRQYRHGEMQKLKDEVRILKDELFFWRKMEAVIKQKFLTEDLIARSKQNPAPPARRRRKSA